MGRKRTKEIQMKDAEKNHFIEPHLDENTLNPDRFFRRILIQAGLWEFVTSQPSNILPMAVVEFYLHLKEGSTVISIIDHSTGKADKIEIIDVVRVFKLSNEGTDPESARVKIEAEFICFTEDPDAVRKTGLNALRHNQQSPFNYFA